jgi:hypothetical protein
MEDDMTEKLKRKYVVYGAPVASALRQFIRFINLVEPEVELTQNLLESYIIDPVVITGWFLLWRAREGTAAFATMRTRMKYLQMILLKFLEQERFKDRDNINLCSTLLKNYAQYFKRRIHLGIGGSRIDSQIENGVWMDIQECQTVTEGCMKHMFDEVTEHFEPEEVVDYTIGDWKLCFLFQMFLFTLLLLLTGGQRKQVFTIFMIDSLVFDSATGDYLYSPNPHLEKKLRPQSAKGFPVPKFLGLLLIFFRDHIRPILLLKNEDGDGEDIISLWIDENGRPAESKTVAEWIRTIVSKLLPGVFKNVTPSVVRRAIPTNIIIEAEANGEDIELLKENLARIMNTSRKMIDEFYDRSTNEIRLSKFMRKSNSRVLKNRKGNKLERQLETLLSSTPQTSKKRTTGMTLESEEEEDIAEEEQSEDEEDDQLESGVYFVEKILEQRIRNDQVEFRVKWKNFPPQEATWEPFVTLLNCRQVLSKWFAIENPSKQAKKTTPKKKKSLSVRAKKSKVQK